MRDEKRIVEIESFTTPGIRYEIDLDQLSCTCPAYRKRPSQPCKHLLSIRGLFFDPPTPDPSEALSAFIKGIRLRRVEDAITWLLYLWRIPQFRGRVQRRVLIAAGEDNLSTGVIEAVARWYNTTARVSLDDAVREVLRICATPNWWAQKEGRVYMYEWLETEIGAGPLEAFTEEELFERLLTSTLGGDLQGSLSSFTALYARARINPAKMTAILSEIGVRTSSGQAKRLVPVYASNIRAFGTDGNVSAQAVYAALVGQFGQQDVPEPTTSEVNRVLQKARAMLANNPKIPAWALDGKHTARFKDGRFAGTCQMMAACCRAFEHYGRLSVDDRWLPSFIRSQ